ncbi:MAG: glycosyltransferase [Schwartzia succinivorans]|nr:glycosyltransferase [Schwartzia succinivorans]
MIKFSVVTATYNAAKTLRQALDSVLSQNYPAVEYIIIDGGSTDGTVDILREYSTHLAYWVSEADTGIYEAFNKGIQAATGDYLYFLGADDCLCDKDILFKVAENLDDSIDILSAGVYVVRSDWNLEKIIDNEHARDINCFDGEMIPHQGMFTKTNILKERHFDTSFQLAGDYDFFMECYFDEKIKFRFVDFPVAYYATGGAGSSAGELNLRERRRIWTKYHIDYLLKKTEKWNFQPSRIRIAVKACITLLGLYPCLLRLFQGWRPHHCNNRICRWCGREG